MRITVDLEPKLLRKVQSLTGEPKKSPAVNKALSEFIRQSTLKEFGALIRKGAFDFSLTNDQIEAFDVVLGRKIEHCSIGCLPQYVP